MAFVERFVSLLTPPHEPYEYALALCGLLLLGGLTLALLRNGRRDHGSSGSAKPLRYKLHLHRQYQHAVLRQQRPARRLRWSLERLRWRTFVSALPFLFVGDLVLASWLTRDDRVSGFADRSSGVIIRRGTDIISP